MMEDKNVMNILLIVFAVIGGLAVLAVLGMWLMHGMMMGGLMGGMMGGMGGMMCPMCVFGWIIGIGLIALLIFALVRLTHK